MLGSRYVLFLAGTEEFFLIAWKTDHSASECGYFGRFGCFNPRIEVPGEPPRCSQCRPNAKALDDCQE